MRTWVVELSILLRILISAFSINKLCKRMSSSDLRFEINEQEEEKSCFQVSLFRFQLLPFDVNAQTNVQTLNGISWSAVCKSKSARQFLLSKNTHSDRFFIHWCTIADLKTKPVSVLFWLWFRSGLFFRNRLRIMRYSWTWFMKFSKLLRSIWTVVCTRWCTFERKGVRVFDKLAKLASPR